MEAPPTPPPMTTALAFCLKRLLGASLRGGARCRARPALREEPVGETDDEDHREREFEHRDVAQEPADLQRAERRVLPSDRRVARPQEVDLHRDPVDEAKDVDPEAPLPELEWRGFLRPPAKPGEQDAD